MIASVAKCLETDWEARYQTHDMPWEKGEASPGLVDFLLGSRAWRAARCWCRGAARGMMRAPGPPRFYGHRCDLAPSAVQLSREKTAGRVIVRPIHPGRFSGRDAPGLLVGFSSTRSFARLTRRGARTTSALFFAGSKPAGITWRSTI